MNENKRKQKLLMLGLDAPLHGLIVRFTEEGNMPLPKNSSSGVCFLG